MMRDIYLLMQSVVQECSRMTQHAESYSLVWPSPNSGPCTTQPKSWPQPLLWSLDYLALILAIAQDLAVSSQPFLAESCIFISLCYSTATKVATHNNLGLFTALYYRPTHSNLGLFTALYYRPTHSNLGLFTTLYYRSTHSNLGLFTALYY